MRLPPPTRWPIQIPKGQYRDHLVGQLTMHGGTFITHRNVIFDILESHVFKHFSDYIYIDRIALYLWKWPAAGLQCSVDQDKQRKGIMSSCRQVYQHYPKLSWLEATSIYIVITMFGETPIIDYGEGDPPENWVKWSELLMPNYNWGWGSQKERLLLVAFFRTASSCGGQLTPMAAPVSSVPLAAGMLCSLRDKHLEHHYL